MKEIGVSHDKGRNAILQRFKPFRYCLHTLFDSHPLYGNRYIRMRFLRNPHFSKGSTIQIAIPTPAPAQFCQLVHSRLYPSFAHTLWNQFKLRSGLPCSFLDYSVGETLFHDEISSMLGMKERKGSFVIGTFGGNSFRITLYVVWTDVLCLLWWNQNQNRVASSNGFRSKENGIVLW